MLSTRVRTLSQGPKNLCGIRGKEDIVEESKGSPLGWWVRGMNEKHLNVFMSIAYFVIGFSPISALALAIIGVLPLGTTTLLLVLPGTVVGIGLALRFPWYGKLALKGLLIGLVAVFLYDCMRAPFILTGVWGDFIPNINMWLFNTSEPNWVVGYIWRYVGDGGFMGMAFTVAYCVLKPRASCRIAALGFGVAIWLCLMLTLVLAPHGQEMLFKLTFTTITLSLSGHLIYGLSIGVLLPYVYRDGAPIGRVARLEGGRTMIHLLRRVVSPSILPYHWTGRLAFYSVSSPDAEACCGAAFVQNFSQQTTFWGIDSVNHNIWHSCAGYCAKPVMP